MVDRVQRVAGSVYNIGPQAQPSAVAGAAASALLLASIDARLADLITDGLNARWSQPMPVTVTGLVAVDSGRKFDVRSITGALPLPANAAQEVGGNLAALVSAISLLNASIATLAAAIGNPTDTPQANGRTGSLIAVMKALSEQSALSINLIRRVAEQQPGGRLFQ